tara:strand:- start:3328 stop:4371 length:1044 start_codon:yes stop_codon:yes gene_type:complete
LENSLKNKTITIAGSGVAGLVAALILKQNGYNPIVYEKAPRCGFNRHGDFEGLETWNLYSNPIEKLKDLGIQITFNYKVFHSFHVNMVDKKSILIKSPTPFFYVLSRGDQPGDLDYELQSQIEEANIKINFNQKIDKNQVDIVATGSKKANAFIRGITFDTHLEDQVQLILGNKIANQGYGYLIVINGKATLAVAYKKVIKKTDGILNKLIDFSSQNFKIKIKNYKIFSSFGSFNLNQPKVDKMGRMYIGEAGGFQDYLFGFGIQYAVESALLATQSILNDESFNIVYRDNIKPFMIVSSRNRKFYEKLNDKQLYLITKILSKSSDPIALLRKRTQPTILDKILKYF